MAEKGEMERTEESEKSDVMQIWEMLVELSRILAEPQNDDEGEKFGGAAAEHGSNTERFLGALERKKG